MGNKSKKTMKIKQLF